MTEKINVLYFKLKFIGDVYLSSHRIGNVEAIKEYFPQITEFVNWFIHKNIFGIEDDLYSSLCNNLMDIVKDILQAIENNDRVLMHDAVQYGLLEYLRMFVEEDVE